MAILLFSILLKNIEEGIESNPNDSLFFSLFSIILSFSLKKL